MACWLFHQKSGQSLSVWGFLTGHPAPKATLRLCSSYPWTYKMSINSLAVLLTTSSICLWIPVSTLSNQTVQQGWKIPGKLQGSIP